jgi:phage terminase large subunit
VSSSTLRIETPRAFVPLLRPARYKGAHGGRGSGKSHFFAELLVEECVADPTTRAVCVREIQKSLDQSVKQLITDKIAALDVGDRFEILDTEIHVLDDRGKRSGIIIFQGMQNHTADSIKSLEGYRIAWVEEAQSLSQRSLDLLTPTLRMAGAEIWFSWNPRQATDPVDAFMRSPDAANDNDIVCIQVNYTDNPWFGDTSLAADMERDRRRDPDKYAHVWLGGYQTNSEARVFRNWRVEAFETPADAVLRFGADWGFAIDPTTLLRMFVQGRTLYIDQEAYKIGCEIDETPALFAGDCPPNRDEKQRWENTHKHPGVPGALKWTITADSARPETVSYMKRKGFRIIPAIKGPGSLEDGIEFLRTFDIVVHPRCVHTIEELTLYSWKTDPLTGEILPVLADKDNHLIDAARYGLEALRRGGAKAKAPMPEPKRRDYQSADRGGGSEWQAA